MAKRPSKRANRKGLKTAKLSPEAREQKARRDLDGGHFRAAIAEFKELLKTEPRPDWQSALSDAYAGRARELAAKDMLKEALVMWENRANLGLDDPFHPDHAALLIRTGGFERVLALFADEGMLSAEGRERLRPLLAARVIAGDIQILQKLAEDDPVRRHADAACAALDAYCANDDEALQAALSALPFRSPYRDWVQILKALQQTTDRPDQARAQLARVDNDSAFLPLRQAAELALLSDAAFLDAVPRASEATLTVACALRGWPPERIKLQRELSQIDAEKRPRALLRLMHQHQASLGADWVRQQALRLLWQEFPGRLNWLTSEGANEFTRVEELLVAAWAFGDDYDPYHSYRHWSLLAGNLMAEPPPDGDDDLHRMRIALALRAPELTTNLLSEAEPSNDPDDLDCLVAKQLEESLQYDADDRDTYLRLIDYYRSGRRLKEVRRLLARASDQWPQDMQILQMALNIALDSGAFKKAAGLARQMLEIDPINTAVRERLVDAHLSHAQKQLNKKRQDLAHKEIASAKDWARGGQMQERIDLTSGLVTFLEDPATGATALRNAVADLGGGLTGRVALALAADNLDIGQNSLQKRAKLAKVASLGREDTLATLNRLRAHLDRSGKKSRDLTDWLDRTFNTVDWKALGQDEMESACDTMRRYELHRARQRAASAALRRWKGMPVFELHAFEAKYPDGFTGYSDDALWKLQRALDRARAEGDNRTASRIQNALHSALPFGGRPPMGFPTPATSLLDQLFADDFEDDDEDDLEDAIDDVFDRALDSQARGMPDFGMLIRALGIEKTFDLLGLPPDLRRTLKQLKREMGEEAMTASLIAFFNGDFDDDNPDQLTPF